MREEEAGEPSMATAMPMTTSEGLAACTAAEMAAMAATTGTAQAQVALAAEAVAEATRPCFVGLDWGRAETREPVPTAEAAEAVALAITGTAAMVGLEAAGAALSASITIVPTAAETEGLAAGAGKETMVLTLVAEVTSEGIPSRQRTAASEVPGRD